MSRPISSGRHLLRVAAYDPSDRRAPSTPRRRRGVDVANHGDWQFGIYFNGLVGQKPTLPMDYATLDCAKPSMHVRM